MPIQKKTILWLDDDFDQDSSRLQSWVNLFDKKQDKIILLKAGNLKDFAQILEKRYKKTSKEPDFIYIILLDVMMRPTHSNANFEQLAPSFASVTWKALDVGVQILKMMQEPIYYARQPKWLHPYRKRKITLLTSNTQVNIALNGMTQKVRERTEVLIKDNNTKPFETWLEGL